MSAFKDISLKKQQKSKYNLCKHQFRGNLKIKNQSISPKRLFWIESNVSHHVLLNFLDYKPLSELLKNFSCITHERRWRVKRNYVALVWHFIKISGEFTMKRKRRTNSTPSQINSISQKMWVHCALKSSSNEL